jgi:Flp pilus assembly protein TadG
MKTLLNAGTALAHKFRQDEDGATALAFALGLTVMLGAIGAGMDISVANKSKSMAQHLGDSVALNAAAYIRDHDEPPSSDTEGFMDGKYYNASDLGYDFGGLVQGDVKIKVVYDMDEGEAVTTVSGATQTTFTSFFGFEKFDFSSSSTVKFKSSQLQQPASVIVVADNSGSMHFHDKPTPFNNSGQPVPRWDTEARIDGLESAVGILVDELEAVGGDQSNPAKDRYVRMGLLPYSDLVLSATKVDMKWGYLSDFEINRMVPTNGTDSSPPMTEAENWMTNESNVHDVETGKAPLRYVVFMTDGQNTTKHWVADDEASQFRRQGCFGQNWSDPLGCTYDVHTGYNYVTFDRAWLDRNGYENTPDSTIESWGYQEGKYEVLGDSITLAACTRMKNQGIRIFTIGFALDEGRYFEGEWHDDSNPSNDHLRSRVDNYYNQNSTASTNASALMSGCASPGDFTLASNNQSLDAAFANIGLKIKQEVIRLSN